MTEETNTGSPMSTFAAVPLGEGSYRDCDMSDPERVAEAIRVLVEYVRRLEDRLERRVERLGDDVHWLKQPARINPNAS